MPTFKEFLRVAEMTVKDKTSGKRMMEIQSVLRKHHIAKGITPEKATAILEDLGPTYVKIGQIMSNRGDLLPREYCDAFAGLRTHVSPLEFDTVLEIIDVSYKHSWKETFADLDKTPLGSASVAQVHKGTLHDGSVVAVKVRRPGIVQQMAEDIMLMKHTLALADFSTTKFNTVTFDDLVLELERTTHEELNFCTELNNLVRFYNDMQEQPSIASPVPYPQHSTEEVLVMEFIEGDVLDGVDRKKVGEERLAEVGENLAQSYVKQVLEKGFFHADPHPGNIVLRDDEIIWVDLGMVGNLTTNERQLVGTVFEGVATGDSFKLKMALTSLATAKGPIDHSLLLQQMDSMLNSYASSDLVDINIGSALVDVIDILRSNNLSLPSSFTMLARGLVTLEGVVSDIAPKTSLIDIVSVHVQKQMSDPHAIKERIKRDVATSVESTEAVLKIPEQLSNTLDMLDRGQLKFTTDMKLPDNLRGTLYSIGGTLGLAFISAGLFIGSSILCTTTLRPQILGVPALGFFGFMGAFVLSVYVIYRTWAIRHRQRNKEDFD